MSSIKRTKESVKTLDQLRKRLTTSRGIEQKRGKDQAALQAQRNKAQQTALKASEQAEAKKSDQGLGSKATIEQRRESQKRVKRTKKKAAQRAKEVTLSKGTVKGATGPPKPPQPQLIRSALNKPKGKTFDQVIQGFYDRSKYPSQAEVKKALETSGLAAKDQFKPQTLDEAANRALYAVTETIGGGVRWATLGLTGDLGASERDTRATLYQSLGAFLTPSVQDMAANYLVGKALQTTAGRKAIQQFNKLKGKLTMPDKLTASQLDDLQQLTKVDDPEFWTTAEGRELFEQLNARVTHYIENPEAYTAGASVIPEDVYIYQTLPPRVTPDIYEQFIAKYGDKVDLSSKALLALLSSGAVPKPDDVLRDALRTDFTDPRNVFDGSKLDELAEQLGISLAELEAQLSTDLQSTIINNTEDTIDDTIEDTTDDTTERETPKLITETIQETVTEEPLEEPGDQITPPLELSLEDQEKRRQMQRLMFKGPVEKYRVSYGYGYNTTIEARSLPEALAKVQRSKPVTLNTPQDIIVERIS